MSKFQKKLIVFIIIIAFGFSYFLYIKNRGKNIMSFWDMKQVDEIYSPDKKNKAVIFQGEGSLTVAPSIRVALVPYNVSKVYTSDVVFTQVRSDSVDVKWENNTELLVKYTEPDYSYLTEQDSITHSEEYDDIHKQIFKIDNIKITYKQK